LISRCTNRFAGKKSAELSVLATELDAFRAVYVRHSFAGEPPSQVWLPGAE